jgi:general secretion pathway protein K
VALLTAVVLVALATVVAAAIAFDTALSARRGGGAAAQDQAVLIAGAAEAFAAQVLVGALGEGSAVIHPGQAWAQPIGPLEALPGAALQASMSDLQGRFNLNSLVDRNGVRDDVAVRVFERLLANLGLEPDWATAMVDWIDRDLNPGPGGAEDGVYTSETPSYRPPNRPITSTSELLALKDFGAERYARLAPFVAALPRDAPLNVCSASGPLLDALTGEQQWTRAPESLARNRAGRCFPRLDAFRATFADATAFERVQGSLGLAERSAWFQLRSVATIGTSEFALYSLLRYEGGAGSPRVRVVTRGFTE